MAQGAVGCKARRVLCGVCARLHAAPGFESAAICSCSHAAPGFESAAICSGRNSGFPHGPAPIRRLRRHLPPRAGEGKGIIFFLRGLRPRPPGWIQSSFACLSAAPYIGSAPALTAEDRRQGRRGSLRMHPRSRFPDTAPVRWKRGETYARPGFRQRRYNCCRAPGRCTTFCMRHRFSIHSCG